VRAIEERADPQRDDLQSEPIGVHPAERLRERLGGGVQAVRARRGVAVEPLADAVEAGGAAGARDDDAPHAAAPRGVVDVEGAVQVRAGEHVERRLVGHGAEVDDRVAAGGERRPRDGIGQVGGDEPLPGLQRGRLGAVGQHDVAGELAQHGPHRGGDPPGGAGQQDPHQPQPGSSCWSSSTGAKQSPWSATRASTSSDVNVRSSGSRLRRTASTSSHSSGVDTVGRSRARSE
jgi:hypothetical protein